MSRWTSVLEGMDPAARAWLASAGAGEAGGVLEVRFPSAFQRDEARRRWGGALAEAARAAGYSGVSILAGPAGGGARTFASFRVTPANRAAYSAVRSLASGPKPDLHPLLLCGPEGCGKSHLLAALLAQRTPVPDKPLLAASVPRLARRIAL